MRFVILLCLVAVVASQSGHFGRPSRQRNRRPSNSFNSFRRPQQSFRRPSRPSNSFQQPQRSQSSGGRKEFRIVKNRGDVNGKDAARICASENMLPLAIENQQEYREFLSVLGSKRQNKYVWTGGIKIGEGRNGWQWSNRENFWADWSNTGGAGRPQPDNRERGGEGCLAILNDFYNDGPKFHDVACSHRKPVACYRKV